jgi:hypothetical protein
MADTPEVITELAAACVSFVHKSLGLTLDYTQDTLPILDHYVRSAQGVPVEVMELMAAPTGAYFGEVVRRHVAGLRWHAPAQDHAGIRLELEPCFLWFNPIGVAREVIARAPEPDWNAHLQLLDADRPLVESALEHAGDVNEADYFTFSVRYEVIELVTSVLVARSVTQGKYGAHFGPELYRVAAGENRNHGKPS